MSTTAQQLIEAAYSRSTANDPGKLATDGELLGLADRLFQFIYAVAAVAAPERFTSRTTLTLGGAPASVATPTDLIDLRRVQTALGAKINVIPVEEIDRGWHLAPAIYRQGSTIVSRGNAGDPVAGDVLTAWVLDAPATLAALSTTLDTRFPTRHVELIIVEMAMYLATKDTGRDAAEFRALSEYRDVQRAAFIQLSGLSTTALQSPHGGVIVQRLNQLAAGNGASTGQG